MKWIWKTYRILKTTEEDYYMPNESMEPPRKKSEKKQLKGKSTTV